MIVSRARCRRGMTVLEVVLVLGALVPVFVSMLILGAYAARLFHHLIDSTTCCPLM
jgi:hypothetical protein